MNRSGINNNLENREYSNYRSNWQAFGRVVTAAFSQQLKNTTVSLNSLAFVISALPAVAMYAWIASQNPDTSKLSYLLIGAPLSAIWNGVVFRTGWSLDDEMGNRTLEFTLISPSPAIVVLFGKAMAQLAYGIPAGILSFLTMICISQQLPAVQNIPVLLISMFFILIGLAVVSLLFAPVLVLAGGRAGFFNGIMPLGVVVSGFIFPTDSLPIGLQAVSWLLPTSWAMSGIWKTLTGNYSVLDIAGNWGMCMITCAVLFAITYFTFKVVEKRIRITGNLGHY